MIAHIRERDQKKQPVINHLIHTANNARVLAASLNMGNLAYLTGFFHDLGKWRLRFKEYLEAAVLHPDSVRRGEVNHSSTGAIYVYRKYYHGDRLHRLTAQLISVAILSHHGLNDCMDLNGTDHFHRRVESLEGLDYDEVMEHFKASETNEEELDEYFEKAVAEVQCFMEVIEKNKQSRSFSISMLERMLLSIVVEADRQDAASFEEEEEPENKEVNKNAPQWSLLCRKLELSLKSKPRGDNISALRKQVADQCLKFAECKTGIYRLSVPTGGAKTLSSMRFALHHALKGRKKHIFYFAPYLSILEQNSEVFRDVLGQAFILEHNSNIVIDNTKEESKTEYNRYKQLTSNWDSPVVTSTFVQFLNTLFSDSMQSVRRLNSLADSVIIVDEIQSLPIQMIYMFNLAMNYLSLVCDSTIILCSATQPVLDQVSCPICMGQPADIIADREGLYRQLKRVRIEVTRGTFDTQRLKQFVVDRMKEKQNLLLILNTKAAAREMFLSLQEHYRRTDESVLLIHLSTYMCARHRMDYIRKLMKLLGNRKIICVSTSLIEAGVDLSFECVIRSFAGMDSIAQAAGRCNRNWEWYEGVVYLIRYKEERLGKLEQIVKGAQCSEFLVDEFERYPERYDNDLLSVQALRSYYERYYYDMSQRRLMSYPVDRAGASLLDMLEQNRCGRIAAKDAGKTPDLEMFQAFKTAGQHFQVINDNTVSVIVPYKEGKKIITQLADETDKKKIKDTLKKAQQATVNIFPEMLKQLKSKESIEFLKNAGVWVLKEEAYDEQMGIVW